MKAGSLSWESGINHMFTKQGPEERQIEPLSRITAVLEYGMHHRHATSYRIVQLEHSLCTCVDLEIASFRQLDILPSRYTSTRYE